VPAVFETGVGGGKNALLGTLLWAPLGGGARDVKFIPPEAGGIAELVPNGLAVAVENKGAGGIEKPSAIDGSPAAGDNAVAVFFVDAPAVS